MKILVMSCDKNEDLFYPFYYCIEKYWPNHPEIFYSTETKVNPYYKTFTINLPWTGRARESVKQIDDDSILLMIDDLFIREPVDNDKVLSLEKYLIGNVAAINFHMLTGYRNDIPINEDIAMRNSAGGYKCQTMCQLWSKEKMIDIFDWDTDPWTFEERDNTKGYTFLINNSNKCVFNWGKPRSGFYAFGLVGGKWCHECKDFFDNEGLKINYSERGFYD